MMQPMPAAGGAAGADVELESVRWSRLTPELQDRFGDKNYPLDPLAIYPDPEEGKGPAAVVQNPQLPPPGRFGQGNNAQSLSQNAASAQWSKYPYPPLPANLGGGNNPAPMPPNRPGDNAGANTKPYEALDRFIDVDVKPGKSYKYSIQVRIANPNYKKTTEVAFAALAVYIVIWFFCLHAALSFNTLALKTLAPTTMDEMHAAA